ncbi:MAG: glycoside hydrolase family 3 C-terminal domain-containing protein [Lachnospiraceae bacterium]|nr:glycoside hydrolase family 3 C-terminal domain-containing protein [Lachnospiraceae bacterium]
MYEYEKDHLRKVRRLAPECTVLLKSNGDFPLAGRCDIALYGNGARHTIMGGTGSGEVNVRSRVSIEEGLKAAGFTLTTTEWLDAYDAIRVENHKEFLKGIQAEAKKRHVPAPLIGMGAVEPEPEYELALNGKGDVAIYVVARISGEGSDRKPVRGDILLSETEKRDILALQEKYEKFLLVLNVGGPVDLTEVEAVENILVLSQLGSQTGTILADLVSGKAYPSGKLATTWAAWEDYCAEGDFGDENETWYREGIYVGYRYFDTIGKKARYPFGYGLGYTTFETKAGEVSVDGEYVKVKATVANTGTFWGREVVQVYVSVPGKKIPSAYQALGGFAKTKELKPGDIDEVEVCFRLSDVSTFDETHTSYVLEAGDYILRLGNDSVNTKVCGVLRLTEDVVTRLVQAKCGDPKMTEWVPEARDLGEVPADVPVVTMDASAIASETISYEEKTEILPMVRKMSAEELAYLNCGGFKDGGGLSVAAIANGSSTVAGAAGETWAGLKGKGIGTAVMSDGPAGLRLATRFFRDPKKGAQSLDVPFPESITDLLGPVVVKVMNAMTPKPKKGAKIYEQYANAIPIGTAIAQSFNLDLAYACGDLVGDEMERFNVTFWLAPALNIHRSIRCGRNFEYFSEDPIMSGLFAAAITKGVQSHPGRGVTIKHYCANNQETNRYASNSHVSERAMREIYLRGFEICVREAKPASVMSSYNLLNGVHTSERKGLTDILRHEFGFDGILMTDWVINGGTKPKNALHPVPEGWRIAAAGENLVMPGSKGDVKSILDGLKSGKLRREQLEINASQTISVLTRMLGAQDQSKLMNQD